MKPIVIIPALEPDEKLVRLIDDLHASGLSAIIVNDDSTSKSNDVFEKIGVKAQLLRQAYYFCLPD